MLIHDLSGESARRSPEKTALVCAEERLTYAQIESLSNQLAHALAADCLDRQGTATLYLENRTETVIALYAILKAAGIFTIINPLTRAEKASHILNDSAAEILITDNAGYERLKKAIPGCPGVKRIIITDTLPKIPDSRIALYPDYIRSHNGTTLKRAGTETDIAAVIYTSGSTGSPKGVIMTHDSMIKTVESISRSLENSADDIILDCLPLSFGYGLYQVLTAFACGATLVLERSFTYPYQVIERIVKEKVTGFPLVPAIAAILLQFKNLGSCDFSRLRYISSAAQMFPAAHIRRLRELFPQVKIFSMYGLTECQRVLCLPPEEIDRRPESCGKAITNIKTRLIDENGKEITRPGIIGELVVESPNIMKGYLNLPEETAARRTEGSSPEKTTLRTNDLFSMDEDGFLYFVSRKDDMIKTAGELVCPREVENALCELGAVAEAAVIGIPDQILGQAVKAFIVLKTGEHLTEQEVLAHCRTRLEQFMVPKSVEFTGTLPKTLTGKIIRKELASQPA